MTGTAASAAVPTAGLALDVYPVTGPPGAGKTTALMSLARQYPGIVRFGVRDYALRLAEAGDPLGLVLRDNLVRNELSSNELVLREFAHFLDHVPPGARVVAADGYPKNMIQCGDLIGAARTRGYRVPAAIVVDVPDDAVPARVAGRRICGRCGAPADNDVDGRCASCGGPVLARTDDALTRLTKRLADHRRLGAEVQGYFAERGLLTVVDGLRDPAEVRDALAAVLLGAPHGGAVDPDGAPGVQAA